MSLFLLLIMEDFCFELGYKKTTLPSVVRRETGWLVCAILFNFFDFYVFPFYLQSCGAVAVYLQSYESGFVHYFVGVGVVCCGYAVDPCLCFVAYAFYFVVIPFVLFECCLCFGVVFEVV